MEWVRGLARLLGAVTVAGSALGCGGSDAVTFCDVMTITEEKCVRCHDDPTRNGAPFSLATYADTQASYQGEPIYERMERAVRSDFMPPTTLSVTPPVEDLTADEVELIGTWADAGAPSGGCD